jgi:hypothetical protein
VSPPLLIVSIAFAQAASPFALEITAGLLPPPLLCMAAAELATPASAAEPTIHCRRFIMF